MTNAELVRAACQVVWSDGEVERAGEFYAEDFVGDYPYTQWGEGLAGLQKLARDIRTGFPDYRERIDELIDGGDRIVVVLTIQATHTGEMGGVPPTGRKVEFRDVTICEVRDGRIVAQRGLTDYMTLYAQLGLLDLSALNAG